MDEANYFASLQDALKIAGVHRPALVIDLDRLNANLAYVKAALAPSHTLRVVDKSLPSLPLMAHILHRMGTNRVMSFHLPVTLAILDAFPDCEVLYGKPLPVAALAKLLETLPSDEARRLCDNTIWLMDTTERLNQFEELAAAHFLNLKFTFEVDTGMHRGGVSSPQELAYAVAEAKRCTHLSCVGLMGYEAHIPEIPGIFGGSAKEAAKVEARMREYMAVLPKKDCKIINTGGSKTAITYGGDSPATEVSMGSGFLKPTDFDVDALHLLKPAVFIATPVLKVLETSLPGPRWVTRLLQRIGKFPRKGCFIYGGKWFAKPVWPIGMKENAIWGLSSNQQLMALADDTSLQVDDLVFFRPTQSEAVLQQFGSLQIYSDGRIIAEWPVLPTG